MPRASEILGKCSIVLQDVAFVRWSLTELGGWLNDGLRAIVLAKPSENSSTVALAMIEGTLQSLTAEDHLLLLGLSRNLKSVGPPRVGGRVIRATTRAVMDSSEPNWHDPETVPYEASVRQYMFDEESPREFYVYPGNDGTGLVEALVSLMPALIDTAPTDFDSYKIDIALREPLVPVLIDYVLFRAFSKDAEGADPGRASVHYQAFASALGIKVQVDTAKNPAARQRAVSQ